MNTQRSDELIWRAIDGDATGQEWRELADIAQRDPHLWQQLGESLRDQAAFARAINASAAIAETVEVPVAADRPASSVSLPHEPTLPTIGRIGAWCGWLVAAGLALAWSIGIDAGRGRALPDGGAPVNSAGMVNTAAAADLLAAYVDKGSEEGFVIGEVPQRVLVETRPAPTGSGYVVVYLRQIMERTTVPDLYEVNAQDELGRPTLVPYQQRLGSFQ